MANRKMAFQREATPIQKSRKPDNTPREEYEDGNSYMDSNLDNTARINLMISKEEV